MNKFVPSTFSKIAYLTLALSLFFSVKSNAQCLAAWEYTRPVTVDNSGNASALTDFQVKITMATDALISASKMKSDGSDIRFTDIGCNNLDYWIESGINTPTTVIWVEVNTIPANGAPNINLFYGNPAATTVSDGEATFQFFDDFDGTSLNTTKWDSLAAAGSTTVISGGTATITTSGASGSYLISKTTVSTPTVTEMNVVSISGQFLNIAQLNPTNTEGHNITNFTSPDRIGLGYNNGTGCGGVGPNTYGGNFSTLIPTSNLLSIWSLAWPSTSTQIMTSPENQTSNSSAYTLPSDVRLGIGSICDAASLETDWARARKYTSPEPAQTLGTETFNYYITFSLPKIEFCPQETFDIDYIVIGNILAGNDFVAELSDAAGDFTTPVELGRITSQTSGTISATIGENQVDGTGYRIRVSATNPPFSSDNNGLDITIHPVVTANFNAGLACAGNPTSFTDLSTIVSGTIDAYEYQFGNGSVSNLKDVNYVYPTSGNYDVTLTVTSNQGCVDDTIISIEVFDKPTADFDLNDTCIGLASEFTNASSGATSYSWSFGDGGTSTDTDPTYTYAQPGTYTVSLIATNADDCTDTLEQSINIYANPNADFSFLSNCAEDTVEFTNTSSFTGSGALSFNWNFDDGNNSTDENPWNIYAASGSYDVSLIVTSVQSCADTTNTTVTVYPNPTALFVADSVCLGEAVVFDNQSSISSGTISYSWTFGDGNTSTNVQANHTYSATGTYEVILWAESNMGCVDADTQTVIIYEQPEAIFSSNTVCQGDTTYFTNVSTGSNLTYAWDFGDGNTSTDESPKHVYAASGVYTVSLAIENLDGCTDTLVQTTTVFAEPSAAFVADSVCLGEAVVFDNQSSISSGTISYSWTFGDGNTSTNVQATHTYSSVGTFEVILTVESNNGCFDADTQTVVIYEQPVADFSSNTVCQGDTTYFTNVSTGSNLTYAWDFGDGNTSTDASPKHVYATNGVYTVSLAIANTDDCTDTLVQSSTVFAEPSAAFVADSICLGETIAFDNQSSISSGSVAYTWNFGDGNTSTNVQANHTYAAAGTYEVVLTVESNNGCFDADTQTVVIYEQPVADFSSNTVCQGDTTEFSNASTGSNLTYAWDFGDGNTSTDASPKHVYAANGMYNVTLAIGNTEGCTDTLTQSVSIYAEPVASFEVDSVCQGNTIDFVNNSSIALGTLSYAWDFGDGSTTNTNAQPSHLYGSAGTYSVILDITSDNGCMDSDTQTVVIYEQPEALFTVNNNCFNDTTFFMDQSTGADLNYNWDFGDGNTDTTASPAYVYTNAGTYTVVLDVINDDGCADTYQTTVTIHPRPVAGFTVVEDTVCLDQAVQFVNTGTLSGGASNYLWLFGDSTTSTDINPNHLYDTAGIYEVTLIHTSDMGCVDTARNTHVVYPLPDADFSLGNSCYGDTVDFTNLSTIDFGNLNYVWDFSDGITDTATNPQHLFNALGIYDITLEVTSDFGCYDEEVKKITVYPVPTANFSFDNECENDEVGFTNLSTISAGQLSYNWEFSDSFSTQNQNPVHVFDGFGDFGVELTVTSGFGCTDTMWDTVTVYPLPDVSFIADPVCYGETTDFDNTTSLPDSSALSSWFWNFGDQEVSFVRNPTHEYAAPGAYDVLLEATSALGCTDTTVQTVIVNELPNNTITPLSATSFCDGDSVILSADPLVDLYSWSEGSSTQDITVTEGGTYSLTVESAFGCIDSNSIDVTVWELPNVVAYTDTTISKGYSVYLSATGAVFYEWSPKFDLESPTSPETKATPLDSTRFIVVGTDLNGCENTDSVTVLVLEDFKVEATNVITANGDGVNDFWEIINIETYPNAEVSIYNRYGNELYSSQQYANDWDGKYNGNELPEGTYYYTIQFDGSEQIYKGAVSILR